MSSDVVSMLDGAIKIEEGGIEFYEKMADRSRNTSVIELFKALLQDEKNHRAMFIRMKEALVKKEHIKADNTFELRSVPVFDDVEKEMVRQKKLQKIMFTDRQHGLTLLDAFTAAKAAEKGSIKHYKAILEKTDDLDMMIMLEKIIVEEMIHLKIVEAEFAYLKDTGYMFDPVDFHAFKQFSDTEIRKMVKNEGAGVLDP